MWYEGGPDRPHDAHDATFLVAAGAEHVLYILAKRPKHVGVVRKPLFTIYINENQV